MLNMCKQWQMSLQDELHNVSTKNELLHAIIHKNLSVSIFLIFRFNRLPYLFIALSFIPKYTITQKMADQMWSDIYIVFTKILCGRNF